MYRKDVLPIIKFALKEDIGQRDITSELIVSPQKKAKAKILAKETGVVCGLRLAGLIFETVDKRIRFQALVSEGVKVTAGQILARLEGRAQSILKAERVALNFLGHLSGIATKTAKFIQQVKPYPVKIMDTRKTTPGLRILEKYAVRCGGGFNHRMGLWDQVLVKGNHLAVCRIPYSVFRIPYTVYRKEMLGEIIRKIEQNKPKGMKIEIEVRNMQEFKAALLAMPDVIMLDNFSIVNIRKAVKIKYAIRNTQYAIRYTVYGRPKLEVSGGVNLSNVRKIAACGVDLISVGELTHSAEALDVSLNCE